MSMEINGRYGQYSTTDYAERLKAEQEKVKETTKVSDKVPDLQDTYISSEKTGTKPSGLYWLGQDENGRKKVFFDDPRKAENAGGNKQSDIKPDNAEKDKEAKQPAVGPDTPEKCTGNTDEVDREIKELKEKKKELEQQIRSAAGDEKKVKELESKLAQVESELSQKDNDTYRRQHTSFSN